MRIRCAYTNENGPVCRSVSENFYADGSLASEAARRARRPLVSPRLLHVPGRAPLHAIRASAGADRRAPAGGPGRSRGRVPGRAPEEPAQRLPSVRWLRVVPRPVAAAAGPASPASPSPSTAALRIDSSSCRIHARKCFQQGTSPNLNGQSYADTLVVPPPPDEPYVRVIPLGGCGEIGRNMTLFETKDDIVAVDCGLMFPDEEMFGVDIVINDFSYLRDRRDKLRALLVTHGHEDHIGGIPYFLREFPKCPIVGTPLTLALIKAKLKEHKPGDLQLVKVEPGDTVTYGGISRRVHPHQPFAGRRVRDRDPHAVGRVLPHRRLQVRPDADRRRSSRLRCHRARRRRRRAVHARRFDERRAPGAHALRTHRRRGVLRTSSRARPGASSSRRSHRTCRASSKSSIRRSASAASSRFWAARSPTSCSIASELKYLDIPDGLVIKLSDVDSLPAGASRRDDDRVAGRTDVGADAPVASAIISC